MLPSLTFLFLMLTPAAVVSSAENYQIPTSTSPLIQDSIKLIPPNDIFYAGDENFYSKVTLLDMSENSQTPLKSLVIKKVNVIFMSAVSSLVGQTMDIDDLKYTTPSKWAYSVPVDYMLTHAAVPEFNDTMLLYKLQEHAMSYLEDRYNFIKEQVIDKLDLELMEYLAPDQNQWVRIVGEITNTFIEQQSEKLNMTPCYMASLVNQTLTDIEGFTLVEVDTHLYDLEDLKAKLPNFLNLVLPRFYNAFSVTPETFPTHAGLDEQIEYYIGNILNAFDLQLDHIASKYGKASENILIPCENDWGNVGTIIKEEAFEQHASNMSITNTTLAALLGIPYESVKASSLDELKSLISDQINPIKEKKRLIEQESVASLIADHGETYVDTNKNVFDLIAALTALTKNHLSLLYSFTDDDYQFAELFNIEDMDSACSNSIDHHVIVTLADMNTGKATTDNACHELPILRAIWNSNTVDEIEQSFGASIGNEVLCSVGNMVTVEHVYRALSLSENGKEVCSTITLQHLTLVTPRTMEELKSMSFQQLVTLMEELKENGELYPPQTTTPPAIAPSPTSTILDNDRTMATSKPGESTPSSSVSGNKDSSSTSIAISPTRDIKEQSTHSSHSKNGDSTEVEDKKTQTIKSSSTGNGNSSTSSVIRQTPKPKPLSTGYRTSSTNLYFLVALLFVMFYR